MSNTSQGFDSLGPRLSEHRGTIRAGGWLWYLGGVMMAGAVLGLVKAITGSQEAGSALLTALAAAGAVSVLLIVPVLRWRQAAVCHTGGIAWSHLLGDKTIRREDLTGVEQLKKVPFFFGLARGGTHTFVGQNGRVNEFHWDRNPDDKTAIEERPLTEFPWNSGILMVPPGSWPPK